MRLLLKVKACKVFLVRIAIVLLLGILLLITKMQLIEDGQLLRPRLRKSHGSMERLLRFYGNFMGKVS